MIICANCGAEVDEVLPFMRKRNKTDTEQYTASDAVYAAADAAACGGAVQDVLGQL